MESQTVPDHRMIGIFSNLFEACGYSSDPSLKLDPAIGDAILKEVTSWGLGYEKQQHLLDVVKYATASSQLFYRSHPLEVKVLISSWIWACHTIEYRTVGIDVAHIADFQRLFVAQKPQHHPLLDRFAAMLGRMYDFGWPQLTADCMVTSALHFWWVTTLEPEPIYKAMPLVPGGEPWSAVVRSRNGIGEALSLMVFLSPTAHYDEIKEEGRTLKESDQRDLVKYIQAIPQIQVFINNVNDIFCFRLETAEKMFQNHIRERTVFSSHKDLATTMDQMVEEVRQAVRVVDTMLEGTGWIEQKWKDFKHGFIAMHRWDQTPYQLTDLGICEPIASKDRDA